MLEMNPAPRLAEGPEGMDVVVARGTPAAELDAELEGALGLAQELGFPDAEHVVEDLDVRQRGLTHADRADLVGFDQGEGIGRGVDQPRQAGGAHPARRTAADDDHPKRRWP